MNLDKSIDHGKEHRKPYHGCKAIDPSCRNHGDDGWSRDNRLYQRIKAEEAADADIEEYEEEMSES